jgi:hypothetical protein
MLQLQHREQAAGNPQADLHELVVDLVGRQRRRRAIGAGKLLQLAQQRAQFRLPVVGLRRRRPGSHRHNGRQIAAGSTGHRDDFRAQVYQPRIPRVAQRRCDESPERAHAVRLLSKP